jgi:thiosulfate/3-mercaptopyruvate sulfurtransferase
LEPWEKVILANEEYSETIHGNIPCTACHLGQQGETEKETAHVGLVSRPSENYEAVCGVCHSNVTATYADSLHLTQAGYWDVIEHRAGTDVHPELDEMFGNHCASCHTSCGDCHISQPASVGGGLIDGHMFNKTPSLTRNCTACHGSRVGNEYMGKNEGVQADVHFRMARMTCTDCHSGMEMHDSSGSCQECHGTGGLPEVEVTHRYNGPPSPACSDCHPDALTGADSQPMHAQHGEQLQCQICHSVSYSSCDSCHVSISETTGNPKFETAGTYQTFVIGKNPLQNFHRPYEYVVLRHIPVDPEAYSFYGENLLPAFNALPTWAYATPHNIQLQTPQNASCAACHGNAELFLTADKLPAGELEANLPVIVEEVPNPFGSP